jgi:hypothetical protein
MIGLPRVRINGFDFDSYDPVQGVVRDEKRDEFINRIITSSIEYIVALNVVAVGVMVCNWWSNGGHHWMMWVFTKFAPGFVTMIENGQF